VKRQKIILQYNLYRCSFKTKNSKTSSLWGRNDWARLMGWVEFYTYTNYTRGICLYVYTLIRQFFPDLLPPIQHALPPNTYSDVDIKKMHYPRPSRDAQYVYMYTDLLSTVRRNVVEREWINNGGLTSKRGRGIAGNGGWKRRKGKKII